MEGKKVDYNSWGKLPFRDPSERMLRVGHGFSKMLSQMKPDLSKVTEMRQQRPGSGRNLSLDPEVGRNTDLNLKASLSMIDSNQADASQLSSTNKGNKLSKIKISKKEIDVSAKDSRSTNIIKNKYKTDQLPKIESAKNL
jgi:hypothetical protein